MKNFKGVFIVVSVALLAGCASTGSKDYAQVYDRKYNEVRLVEKQDAGSYVGTSASRREARLPGVHP